MTGKKTISFGASFEGSISYFGIGTFLLGSILLFYQQYIWGGILIFIGILLFILLTGVQIDYTNQRIRNYYNFLFFKIGEWKPLKRFNNLKIVKENYSQTMNSRGTSTTVKVKSFDVYAEDPETKNKILLGSFDTVSDAEAQLEYYKNHWFIK